jgi:hypothetical protein
MPVTHPTIGMIASCVRLSSSRYWTIDLGERRFCHSAGLSTSASSASTTDRYPATRAASVSVAS